MLFALSTMRILCIHQSINVKLRNSSSESSDRTSGSSVDRISSVEELFTKYK